ncbi:hypothetical protein [Dokdonella sp.]|uniref:hypothetical protein n=1 Tax=Dokdonella sp. TaxID=2291710 RepID=UPI001AFF9F78|nr:hypothetical protein [Dokdonella sp.]MBO9664746.1 hypothetical protein [Dokdonella sp.]
MTDFEIQRRLREMNAPRAPQLDLWPAIEKRIANEERATVTPRRRGWLPLAAAAGLLVAVSAGVLVLGWQQRGAAPETAMRDARAFERELPHVSPSDADLRMRSPGGDPRLAGAGVVLDAAQAELEQALAERPDATFLVGLLNRTNARRMKLDHYGANAG